jgi:hypothetical protein
VFSSSAESEKDSVESSGDKTFIKKFAEENLEILDLHSDCDVRDEWEM